MNMNVLMICLFRHLHERTPYNNRLYSEITAEKVCEMKKCSNSLYI